MTRPWSAYLRKATDLIPPMPVNLRDRLRSLLAPELADLRQQLDQARKLAGEAQGRYRQEQCHNLDVSGALETSEKQLRSAQDRCDSLTADLARAKADLDERHGPLLGPIIMERDQLRARVAEFEAEQSKLIEGSPMAQPMPDRSCGICGKSDIPAGPWRWEIQGVPIHRECSPIKPK